ncbi:MAG: helix-turn-helix domain-containing protein [Burkholderiales bacterium]|nr:helix-turn-helix domain-containing protein [Burkholderiales bacterium]MDE2399163.1 helix-turn-helix domain-containing protein [Burkholderiales bacterium]
MYDSNMPRLAESIRHYGLYGESGQLPDVMHCETIAERSVLHDWELAPHRHDRLHQFLLLRSGRGMARLDDTEIALAPGSLVNVPVGTVHAFTFEPGTDGFVLTLADAMRDELLARDPEVQRRLGRCWASAADAAVDAAMAQLAAEYAGRSPARALVLRGLGGALLGRAARVAERADPEAQNLAESRLLQRFEALLEMHLREHWRVADYAGALGVTPTHLSRVLRSATGAPASRLIDARVIREARRQLAFTNLGVATIAYTLGFADPALFSRVFARVAGRSPRAFREQLALRR